MWGASRPSERVICPQTASESWMVGDGGDLEFLEPFELELAKSHDQGGCAKPLMPSLRPAKKVWTFPTPAHTKGLLFTPGRSSEK